MGAFKTTERLRTLVVSLEMGHSTVLVLSVLYAWILVLLGIASPITEALRGAWQMSHVVAAFNVYLDLGATVFLIYFQAYHVYWLKHKQKKHGPPAENHQTDPIPSGSTSPAQKNSPTQIDSITIRRRSVMQRSLSESSISPIPSPLGTIHENGYCNNGFMNTSTETLKSGGVVVSRRVGRGRQNVEQEEEERIDEEEEEEILEEYITLHRGMTTISDEVTSFYLRLGVLVFAIGNLIYLGIQIEHNEGYYSFCNDTVELSYPYYLHLLFVVAQTFFLFKNSTLTVRKHRGLVCFGMMHVLATNMCIWLRVLVFEVMEAIKHGDHGDPHHSNHPIEAPAESSGPSQTALPGNATPECPDETLLQQSSSYLYPFVLEYSLIGAATMACMYQAVNMDIDGHILKTLHETLLQRHKAAKSNGNVQPDLGSHHHEHTENSLDKSHVGMFLGFLVLTGCVVSIILFYYWTDHGTHRDAELTFHVMDFIMESLMLMAVVAAMREMRCLGYSRDDNSRIDHVLLLLSFAGLFLLELFTMIMSMATLLHSEFDSHQVLNSLNVVLAIIQGILQCIFLIDGMQRHVISHDQARDKPGRGFITFLIVANVATWLFKTIQEKKLFAADGEEFYGDAAWAVLLNTSLPLLLFFRFHSSICFAHIWHAAYHLRDNKSLTEEGEKISQTNGDTPHRVSFSVEPAEDLSSTSISIPM